MQEQFCELQAKLTPGRATYQKIAASTPSTAHLRQLSKEVMYDKYLKEFRVEQCPLFLQHKCQQHRPFTCFNWHFQNQRRRRPVKQKDGFFNYSSDIYCTKYDEATGICPDGDGCPLLHRTSGDTERRYHLKYYKTSLCVHSSDSRGFCIKNGPHCAFGHGNNDLRDKSFGENDNDHPPGGSCTQSEKEQRSNIPDDPKWRDTQYVILHYKTEFCKKPPRLCRQGYACPYYHNGKDKRRSYLKIRYRSTPCPNVKSGDEWGDPAVCEAGDDCMYCHTRTEQQFHPEIYKSTKCNDMASQSYCPRGVYCAFAHSDNETVSLVPTPPESGQNNNINYSGDFSVRSVSSDEGVDLTEPTSVTNRAVGSATAAGSGKRMRSKTPPFEENGISSPIDLPLAKPANVVTTSSLASSFESGLGAINNYSNKNRFLSGDNGSSNRESLIRRQLFAIETDLHLMEIDHSSHRKSNMVMADVNTNSVTNFPNGDNNCLFSQYDPIEPVGNYFDELSIDQYDGNKSRKSSGFSETTSKSRQYSGYEHSKSRNCSGNSGSPGYMTNGYLNGSSPLMIPNSGNPSPQGNSPPTNGMNGYLQKDTLENINLNSSLGLFELGNGCMNKAPSSPGSDSSITLNMKDIEIKQLKDELTKSLNRLATWEETMSHARAACEAWKNESAKITKKLEEALREKESALAKVSQLQKELDTLNMETMHRSRLISDLKSQPMGQLKAIEWKLKTDLNEVEQIIHAHSENAMWITNSRLFDFPNDWMSSTPQPLFGSLSQQ